MTSEFRITCPKCGEVAWMRVLEGKDEDGNWTILDAEVLCECQD